MALPYGFKNRANRIARQTRASLGLTASAPLSPWRLSRGMGIPVVPLSSFAPEHEREVDHLMHVDPRAFSAGTFELGGSRLIVFNDANSPDRQTSDLAHELSHVILDHRMLPVLDERGCRLLNKDLEDQANWLGPALLISDEAALQIARNSWQPERAAAEYGVSVEVARFRLNVTAAYRRVA